MALVAEPVDLSDFLRNHEYHVARIKESKTPELLTVNGQPEVVIQDAKTYQDLLDQIDHLKAVAAIKEGIAASRRGETKPAAQVFAEMKQKYGLPG